MAPFPETALTAPLFGRILLVGLVCGLAATVFVELTELIKHHFRADGRYAPQRIAAAGAVVVLLTVAVRTRAYNGLSLPLISAALSGAGVVGAAFAMKLLFTAITVDAGFPGGEVTPLLCVGACLGATLAGPLGGSPTLLAAVGYTAVYATPSNTPLACTIMAAELLGSAALVPCAIANVVAYQISAVHGVYPRQRIDVDKSHRAPPVRSLDVLHDPVRSRRGRDHRPN